jgi:uncharacterized Fe-S cluster-containing protein
MSAFVAPELPGLDCGLCGYRTCDELAAQLGAKPELLKRCIMLSDDKVKAEKSDAPPSAAAPRAVPQAAPLAAPPMTACAAAGDAAPCRQMRPINEKEPWKDSLGRDFDFFLEHFPEEPGPRETILPHNPMITREMDIQVGDILIGRPLGMSCGCPITHCGVAMSVDKRTGVIVWCVTGPLNPRQGKYKDLGYYIAEAYDGLITASRSDVRIGARYFFQPRMCMLQWRHSGLVNYLNRTNGQMQVRLEGLWIG